MISRSPHKQHLTVVGGVLEVFGSCQQVWQPILSLNGSATQARTITRFRSLLDESATTGVDGNPGAVGEGQFARNVSDSVSKRATEKRATDHLRERRLLS